MFLYRCKGFTLVELMIVIAVVGILAAIAIPMYQTYSVRSKVSEALVAANPGKEMLAESFHANGVVGMNAAASAFNAVPAIQRSSKYVLSVQVTGASSPWPIVVAIAANLGNGIPTSLNGSTLVLSPNVQGMTPAATSIGAIDWASSSATNSVATARGLNNRTPGTLPSRFAPSECR